MEIERKNAQKKEKTQHKRRDARIFSFSIQSPQTMREN